MASRAAEPRERGQAIEPGAVVWSPAGDAGGAPDRERRAKARARRRGALGLALGWLAAAILFYLQPHRPKPACAVAAVALLFAAIALASPTGLYPKVERLLDAFGRAVGAAVTWVLMTLLFFLFVLPVGAILRAAGKLAITKGFDAGRPSSWSEPSPPAGAGAYRKQF